MKKRFLSIIAILSMMTISSCSFNSNENNDSQPSQSQIGDSTSDNHSSASFDTSETTTFDNTTSNTTSDTTSEDTSDATSSDTSSTTSVDTSSSTSEDEDDYGTFPFEFYDDFTSSTGVYVPRIKTTQVWTYTFDYDSYYGEYIDSYCPDNGTIGVNSLEDKYLQACEDAGWINTNDDVYTYDEYGYFYDDPTDKVEVQFYTYQGYFNIFVYVFGGGDDDFYTHADNFPGTALDEFVSSANVAAPKIDYESDWYYAVYEADGEDLFITYCDDEGAIGVDSLEDKYLAACQAAHWVCTNDGDNTYEDVGYLYADPDNKVEVCFFSLEGTIDEPGTFMLTAYFLESDEGGGNQDLDAYIIDLSDQSQITSKTASKVVWETSLFTMTVETTKDSTVNVGNESYFANPLRLYMKQKITFTWKDAAPSQIKINVNTDYDKSDIENISSGATITGATASVSDNVVTYNVSSSATSVTILVAGKTKTGKGQTYIDSVQFVGK